MPSISGPRGSTPVRPTSTSADAPTGVVGTFKPSGWGVMSPLRQLTLGPSGDFKATLRGGEQLTGRFELRDGAAAFMDTLRLTGKDGRELRFGVTAKRDAQGTVTELKRARLGERGAGLPFTLRLQ